MARDLRSYSSWSSSSTKVTASGSSGSLKQFASTTRLSSILQQQPQRGRSVSQKRGPLKEKEDIKVLYEKDLAILYQLPIKYVKAAKNSKNKKLLDSSDSPPSMTSYDLTQKIVVAKGPFSIYKIFGQTAAYLKCGQFVHPILPRLRLWRVLKTQFLVPQPNPGRFWRLEIPELETDSPESIVELELKLRELCTYRSVYKGDGGEDSIKASLEKHLELDPLGFPLIAENDEGNASGNMEEFEDDNEYDDYLRQWAYEFSSDYGEEEVEYYGDEYDGVDELTVHEEINNRYSTALSTLDIYLDSFDGFNVVSSEDSGRFDSHNKNEKSGSSRVLKGNSSGNQSIDPQTILGAQPRQIHYIHHHYYNGHYTRSSIREMDYGQFDTIYETRPDMITNNYKDMTDTSDKTNNIGSNINRKNSNYDEGIAYWERMVSKVFSWTK
jgi:hypothetical protein